ncbi:hypothetical protein BSL78_07783, partial [Apostichopus japonicus]
MEREATMCDALNESSVSLSPERRKGQIPTALKLLIAGLLLLCFMLFILLVILAATHRSCTTEDKIWTFAVAYHDVNIAYIDNRTGAISGYNVDVINAICQLANKDCAIVWDEEINCWDSSAGKASRGGAGLFNGWYDGCAGMIPTKERNRTFSFSKSYFKGPAEMLWARKNDTVARKLPINVKNQKIGFVDGWHSDEFCLLEQTNIVGFDTELSNFSHYPSMQELVQAMMKHEIDLAFCSSHPILLSHLQPLTSSRVCATEGPAVMHRKDSRLSDWWNPALEKLIKSAQYVQICEDLTNDKH